jgi:hypothetical protein
MQKTNTENCAARKLRGPARGAESFIQASIEVKHDRRSFLL